MGWSFIIFSEDFENVAKFKYFGTAVTNMYEKIKSRLNSWNACYHLVQNLFFSHLPFIVYGCESWVSLGRKNISWGCLGCWRTYLDLRGRKKQENGETCKMWNFMLYAFYQILFEWSDQGGWEGGGGMWHKGGRREMHTEFWWANLKERLLGRPGCATHVWTWWHGESWCRAACLQVT